MKCSCPQVVRCVVCEVVPPRWGVRVLPLDGRWSCRVLDTTGSAFGPWFFLPYHRSGRSYANTMGDKYTSCESFFLSPAADNLSRAQSGSSLSLASAATTEPESVHSGGTPSQR